MIEHEPEPELDADLKHRLRRYQDDQDVGASAYKSLQLQIEMLQELRNIRRWIEALANNPA
jgi:hypothetical protein